MGKPYAKELQQLQETYTASMNIEIGKLQNAVAQASSLPLLVIGSGDSLAAAHFVASLHQRFTKKIAKAITPLELMEMGNLAQDCAVWCLSGGGRNALILSPRTLLLVG